MALILDTTGKNMANPPMQTVRKGFESLMITTSVPFTTLNQQSISIQLQRKSGNIDLFQGGKIAIKDLIRLSTNGQGAISYDADGNLLVLIDLTPMGNIPLQQNEEVQINIFNLGATEKWIFNTIEAPFDAVELYQFKRHIMAQTTTKDDFDVSFADTILFQKSGDVTDVRLTYANPQFKQSVLTLPELEATVLQSDPICELRPDGTVKSNFQDCIIYGLEGVTYIEVNKGTASTYTLFTREIL